MSRIVFYCIKKKTRKPRDIIEASSGNKGFPSFKPLNINIVDTIIIGTPIQSIKIIKVVVVVIIYSPSFSFSVETGYILNSFKSSSSSVLICSGIFIFNYSFA